MIRQSAAIAAVNKDARRRARPSGHSSADFRYIRDET
jgi:hypothetical protein